MRIYLLQPGLILEWSGEEPGSVAFTEGAEMRFKFTASARDARFKITFKAKPGCEIGWVDSGGSILEPSKHKTSHSITIKITKRIEFYISNKCTVLNSGGAGGGGSGGSGAAQAPQSEPTVDRTLSGQTIVVKSIAAPGE